MADMQARHYILTINNPEENGFPTADSIIDVCKSFKAFKYTIFQLEEGSENHTKHYQLYICFNSAVRFSSVKNKFPTAHIEKVLGTKHQAIDYCSKSDTRIDGPYEYGDDPTVQGKRVDLDKLVEYVKEGKSNIEIYDTDTSYIRLTNHIDKIRQEYVYEQYKNKWRDLEVNYIWGKSGVGKTRSVMEQYGYENVYRITDYQHPFDSYQGQDIILFDEFRSSLKITDMLNYLDGYPLQLPCRYNNKYACYTKAYLISNIPIHKQYKVIQLEEKETYDAFLRRVHTINEIGINNNVIDNNVVQEEFTQAELEVLELFGN